MIILADAVDVAIRVGVPEDSGLIHKHLAACPIVPVASPDYIRRYGAPQTPRDLRNHRMIAYALHGGVSEWKYKDKNGKIGVFRSEGVFRANTAEMMLQAALDSVGIALLPLFSAHGYVQSKQLIRILPDCTTEPVRTIFALAPPNRYRAAKVRLFLDWLAQACKAMPWEIDPDV
ncbi:MAG: substrate binding domain-containing protein [Alphaproteobacteria bacterium]|nr:substrate binding domain-containing protein [Alphaproteobacteria bacterium]